MDQFFFKETLIVSPIKETTPLSDKEIQDLFDKFPGFGEKKKQLNKFSVKKNLEMKLAKNF